MTDFCGIGINFYQKYPVILNNKLFNRSFYQFVSLLSPDLIKNYFSSFLDDLIVNNGNVERFNNIAYYFEQAKAYDEAIIILEKIITQSPYRTVAYLNLADAYWGKDEQKKAIEMYQKYVDLMQKNGKENRIPQYVLKRITP